MYVTFAIILVIIVLLWKLGAYNHSYFSNLGITGPKPWPYLGNLWEVGRKGIYGLDLEWKNKYGKLFGHYLGSIPILVVFDRELIKQICIKEAHNFTDRLTFGAEGYPLNKAITVVKGAEWKRIRNFLTPTFTAGKMRKMIPLIHDCVVVLQQRFVKSAESNDEIDTKAYFSGFTMDVIASTMFGLRSGAQENPDDEFYKMSQLLLKFSFFNPGLMLMLFWPKFAKIMVRIKPGGFLPPNVKDYFLNTITHALRARESSDQKAHDFLALMLKARGKPGEAADTEKTADTTEDTKAGKVEMLDGKWGSIANPTEKSMTEHEIIAQSIVMMIAGYETTASTLNTCAFYLAKHPEHQDKCRQEIQEVLGNEAPNYDNVEKLHWLDLCIQETMRIHPPALRFDRVAACDMTLKDSDGRSVFIPKGLDCAVPVQAIQCDPELWDNPTEFNPERFDGDELERRRHNLEFLPFGLGPRNCIGMRFALMELKVALAHVLSAVRFVPCEKTPEKLKFNNAGILDASTLVVLRMEKV